MTTQPSRIPASADLLTSIVRLSRDRLHFWGSYLAARGVISVAEIGVWKGEFASAILEACPSISTYYMIDPWKNLKEWDKPFNVSQDIFDRVYQEAIERTNFAGERRTVLRGKAIDVIRELSDHSLDYAYIDGDHTLQGITTDLINILPKMKPDAMIGGDDFRPAPWSQGARFEPTMVFPFTVNFALAIGATVYALPFEQFLMFLPSQNASQSGRFIDLTGDYPSLSLRELLVPPVRTALRIASDVWQKRLMCSETTLGTILRKKQA